MLGLPPEIAAQLAGHGPAGVIIGVLLFVIRHIFIRWDADRERLIVVGQKYAELAWATAKALEVANANSTAIIGSVETMKLLSELKRSRT